MTHYKLKRLTSLLLSIMVFVVMTMASAAEVNAASSKTFYVPKTETESYNYSSTYTDGSTYNNKYNETYSNTYNKNGLQTKMTYSDGYSKYTRNSKGYVTVIKRYNKKGKLNKITEITRKSNGDASKQKSYTYSGGKKHLESTTTYTYWSKGKVKKEVYTPASGSKITSTYDKKGTMTSEKSQDGSFVVKIKPTYKNGRLAKTVETHSGANTDNQVVTTNYTYTVKNGKVTKAVVKSTIKSNGETLESTVSTTTNTYNSKGYLTKSVREEKMEHSFGTTNIKEVRTITYKKVSVKKKYWSLFK